ncbi:OmcA/MtrC family decaheme c-type cytochrome [Kineobactrum salinum]|uniref:OmcA/MtrC family decaheme c-type cytochrome n=1 Tax=Kineobactrum salinum TaxID=2708301 RepID=A0A6C0U608_9GAMM|nr:OmcA/MtrC family decaheme c-type cytochrome [Kineobactrum salinum]QIB66367.1 OmcA/MtrC family decaheme c-type cytochrome [Kineobactrum salinum]
MTRHIALSACLLSLLIACGGGGGGDRAPGVEPGPPPPGGPVTPPPPELPQPNPAPYAEASELFPFITSARIPEDGRPVVEFQLSDGNNTAITDLAASNVRFIIAKLTPAPEGNLTGSWQSYINSIEQPGVGPGAAAKLRATTEDNGEFSHEGGGHYRYRFATAINDLAPEILDQADSEGLDLGYDAGLTHRVAIQFSGGQEPANPSYDWVPASGARDNIFRQEITTTANCNRCHDQLTVHGGRTEIDYCVTCHNPGSTDANSGNTVDMKVMIHKIHRGAALPSVQAGGEYAIYGFRDSKHDYSELRYPQDIRRCTTCHAGTATGAGREDLVLTAQGDNWAEYSSRAVCGSCHDDLDFDSHAGGQPDDSRCASCHSASGRAGSIAASHRIPLEEARRAFRAEILAVENTAPGQRARVSFRVQNPLTGEDYDLANDPVWRQANSSLNVRLAWDTRDYHNTGNGSDNASSIGVNALASASANGDGSYSVTLPLPVPNSDTAPGIAASGSGVAVIDGHPAVDYNDDGTAENVPVGDVHAFFPIDEADGLAVPRRQSVELEQCLVCHGSLVFHGDNRADNIDSCVSCHNPRNTDRDTRAVAANPPTDGKQEESLDFKHLIHGIHAAAMRTEPLQIVGFRGFTTYSYDTSTVHYPGRLDNCLACHRDSGFSLPLAEGVLATTVDTGPEPADPRDDRVATAATTACAGCHDSPEARAHMTANGGHFNTTQQAVDNGEVVEQCALCHGAGRSQDVAEVHRVRALP